MDWFQHETSSISDPDIVEAENIFGDAGYSVFFKLLELYGKEFSHLNDGGWWSVSRRILAQKLRKRWTKVELILNYYQIKHRIFWKESKNINKYERDHILINIPKFIDKASNWTKRTYDEPTEAPTEAPIEAPTAKEEEQKKNRDIKNEADASALQKTLSNHWEQNAGTYFREIKKHRDEILEFKIKNLNIDQYIQQQIKKQRHPGAIEKSMFGLLTRLQIGVDIKSPHGYLEKIMASENGNFNERESILIHEKMKGMKPHEIEKLTSSIIKKI